MKSKDIEIPFNEFVKSRVALEQIQAKGFLTASTITQLVNPTRTLVHAAIDELGPDRDQRIKATFDQKIGLHTTGVTMSLSLAE